MSDRPVMMLQQARTAIRSGDATAAQHLLDRLNASLTELGLDPDDRPAVEAALADLRILAEAALAGTQSALDHLKAVLECARSLQTYDNSGRRRVTSTQPAAPHRY